MTDANPVLQRYMTSFEAALKPFDSAGIVSDLRRHIGEAQALGKPLDEVLASIGPAESAGAARLARRRQRQLHHQQRSAAGDVLRVNPPAMRRHDLAGDGKPEA